MVGKLQFSPNICDDDIQQCVYIDMAVLLSRSGFNLYSNNFGSPKMRQIYSSTLYLRMQVTSLTFMVAFISLSLNSRMISDAGSPPTLWINLFGPSNVMILLTSRPSKVSSSNSLLGSNSSSCDLNVDDVINLYLLSPNFFNSTVGVTVFPTLRRNQPTPRILFDKLLFHENESRIWVWILSEFVEHFKSRVEIEWTYRAPSCNHWSFLIRSFCRLFLPKFVAFWLSCF